MITVPPNKSTLVLALWVSYAVNQTLRLCTPGAENPMWGSPRPCFSLAHLLSKVGGDLHPPGAGT